MYDLIEVLTPSLGFCFLIVNMGDYGIFLTNFIELH